MLRGAGRISFVFVPAPFLDRAGDGFLNLKGKMEPLKSRKGTKNQGFAVNDLLTSRGRELISPTLLSLVTFGAFRGFHFGI